MSNEANKPTEKQRDEDEISAEDLESVTGGVVVRGVVTDNKHPEGARIPS